MPHADGEATPDRTAADRLAAKAKQLPKEPGVYTFFDDKGNALYVGKARSLRDRVTSYFSAGQSPRIARMLSLAHDVEVVLVGTDKEAYLLEASLIRERRPRYNVMLTDDKRYPWILVSDEDHPRIAIVRDQDASGTYYGPFPDAGSAKALVNLMREAFGIRDCRVELPKGCIKHDIGLCMAPCFREEVEDDYLDAVDEVHKVLRGNPRPALEILDARMQVAAEALEFERAARLRDRIARMRTLLDKQAVFATGREDVDAVWLEVGAERSVAVVVPRRGGRIVDAQPFELAGADKADEVELVTEFVERYYEHRSALPRQVLVPDRLPSGVKDLLTDTLSVHAGRKVTVRAPQRGEAARLLRLAERNAAFQLAKVQRARGPDPGVTDLAERLRLDPAPRRIECVDVSHHGGRGVVASLVTFLDGHPNKRGYRTFNISRQANDDVAAIHEVVTRRLSRLAKEGSELPDLLVVDGGQSQANSAREASRELGLPVPIVGLAKREEEVWRPGWSAPIRLPRNAPGLKLLQRARDEAHRVAIGRGRKRREKDLTTSLLDAVPGVGPTLRRRLLTHFGSVEGVRGASVEELCAVDGVGPELARRVLAVVQQGA